MLLVTVTGFILGSVSILWPWQKKIFLLDELENQILKKGEPIVVSYERILPEAFNSQFLIAIGFIILGILSIWIIEKSAETKK